MITVAYERSQDFVTVIFAGFMTIAEVRQFHLEFRAAVSAARQATGRARVLVHSSNLVQSAEVMEAFLSARDVVDPEKDRVAIMADSSLIKMQVQRGLHGNQKAFLSQSAAQACLMTDET